MSSNPPSSETSRHRLCIIFGDQLDIHAPMLSLLKQGDTVLMMEVTEESIHVPSHFKRTTLFLSAMRHFRDELVAKGLSVRYVSITDPENAESFESEIKRAVGQLNPSELICTEPGEWRVREMLERVSSNTGVPLALLPDTHFLTSISEFQKWAKGKSSLTMEFFYRDQRRRTGYLMTTLGKRAEPEGGVWNFDKDNRLPFGPKGPQPPPPTPLQFDPDSITIEVIEDLKRVIPNLPGSPQDFNWPVTRDQALGALDDFIVNRLSSFGPYEDAMWTKEPTLYHSTLSACLNLKLISPRECCDAAMGAYQSGKAPLQSVEAFIRQIIGWREFIRGIYWLEGPDYSKRNGLDQHGELPEFYWNGDTDMACLRACVGQVVDTGFAHHIQRLMVMGNFALISGIHPKSISDWYLGMFVDGIDWVTLPNTLGMVMHADKRADSPETQTGLVGTKPYAASGRYISRMSNYCKGCRYKPDERTGSDACPFTVFYWDFLIRNAEKLSKNQRMTMMLKNLDRLDANELDEIQASAQQLRQRLRIS